MGTASGTIERKGARVGRLPHALLAAIILAAAVESTLARRTLDFTMALALQYRATAGAIRDEWRAEIVCFGDSVVKTGVLPGLIAGQTGRPAYNFALLGGQPMDSYYVLRRVLDQGARPKAILLGFTPFNLARDPRAATRGLNEIVRPAEAVDLARTTRETRFLTEAVLARVMPSYRCREDIRAKLMQALRGAPVFFPTQNLVHLRNWRVNRGSQVNEPMGSSPGSTFSLAGATYYPDLWYLHPLNAAYIDRFLKLAFAQGSTVYWLLPPTRPDTQVHLERNGVDGHCARFVQTLQAAFPRLIVIDGRYSGYGDKVFVDPIHLDRQGAEAFSAGLAGVLARHQDVPPGPRWLDLPPYHDAPASIVVEDIGQSRQALRARSNRRG